MNIYISNLSYSTTSESLQKLFSAYGETTSANIIMDKFSGRSRGFGFVEMTNNIDGQKAINALNNSIFEGKMISVNIARPRLERN